MIMCDGCDEKIPVRGDCFELVITGSNAEGARRRLNSFDLCSACRERVKQYILVTLSEEKSK